MDFNRKIQPFRTIWFRHIATQTINFGMILVSALMIWKIWICLSGSEAPVVVVLTGSMEPGFRRGDLLFLHMSDTPIQVGEIVVFNVEGRKIPIVHRVITVHRRMNTSQVNILTKGDNNLIDDRGGIYAAGQLWLEKSHVMGRVTGFVPYAGWATIILEEKPVIKYLLAGALGLMMITSA